MSETSMRRVTFDPLLDGDNPNAITLVNFTIEPPINVHNADFLNDAVLGLGWDNMCGAFPRISKVDVNYSDDESTHGVVHIQAGETPDKFHSLIESSFVPALSLGNKTVELVFKSEA